MSSLKNKPSPREDDHTLPFRRLIELRIAQGEVQGVMAQEFFNDLQGRTGIEQVGRKGVPPMPISA